MDDLVVGAGILGLAHAYHLSKMGRKVLVVERGYKAVGASCRNFGMVWPIGQPVGQMQNMALASRQHWENVVTDAGFWHDKSGSLHLAYHEDEASVLSEYQKHIVQNSPVVAARRELLAPSEIRRRAPLVNAHGLKCGLWSHTEMGVDPREVIWGMPAFLNQKYGVQFQFSAVALPMADGNWRVGPAQKIKPTRVWVCSGEDFETLYPEVFAESGLIKCKLQMMRAEMPEKSPRLGVMLAAGLTLCHYKSFAECKTLPALRARLNKELPEYDRLGIHVLVSQQGTGEITIGDSHEYQNEIEPYDKCRIDDLILRYLDTFLDLDGLRVTTRWNGCYAKHPSRPFFIDNPEPNVTIVNGPSGAGMTLSFGLAEHVIKNANI
ncbi:MAG: TIGR03364 family FAD-dependent oxidoreductase [bacterium]